MKDKMHLLQLQIATAMRHFLLLMGQRHQPALLPAPVRQPSS